MEVWVKYNDLMEVSNYGHIRTFDKRLNGRNCTYIKKSIVLKSNPSKSDGYIRVEKRLALDENLVHRIVAKVFIPNPLNKPFVNHMDGVKSNNRADNLEWCNNSENVKHAYAIGLNSLKGEGHPMAKINYLIAGKIRKDYASGKLTFKEIGEKYNISGTNARDIVKSRTWNYDSPQVKRVNKRNIKSHLHAKVASFRGEKWKQTIELGNPYFVSNFGRVKKIKAAVNRVTTSYVSGEKLMTLSKGKGGFLFIHPKNGNFCFVHRLVAKYFVRNPKGHFYVVHKDLDKNNNKSTNLSWVNAAERIRINGQKVMFGSSHPRAKITEDIVRQIREDYRPGTGRSLLELVEKYNINRNTLKDILKRKNWKHI